MVTGALSPDKNLKQMWAYLGPQGPLTFFNAFHAKFHKSNDGLSLRAQHKSQQKLHRTNVREVEWGEGASGVRGGEGKGERSGRAGERRGRE